MKNPLLFNIQHFSVFDGPGIRTVLFLKGCMLRCDWCHNPESKCASPQLNYISTRCKSCGRCAEVCPVEVHDFSPTHRIDFDKCISCKKCVEQCPNQALEIIGRYYTYEEIYTEIKKDELFFGTTGGITISGGEPFFQTGALFRLLSDLKGMGYHICMETAGYTSRENLIRAAQYTDLFLYDCKLVDDKMHMHYTGVSNKGILENLFVLDECNASVILRCPIIPDINDNVEHIRKVAEIAESHPSILHIELEPYHPLGIAKARGIGYVQKYALDGFPSRSQVKDLGKMLSVHTGKKIIIY